MLATATDSLAQVSCCILTLWPSTCFAKYHIDSSCLQRTEAPPFSTGRPCKLKEAVVKELCKISRQRLILLPGRVSFVSRQHTSGNNNWNILEYSWLFRQVINYKSHLRDASSQPSQWGNTVVKHSGITMNRLETTTHMFFVFAACFFGGSNALVTSSKARSP